MPTEQLTMADVTMAAYCEHLATIRDTQLVPPPLHIAIVSPAQRDAEAYDRQTEQLRAAIAEDRRDLIAMILITDTRKANR